MLQKSNSGWFKPKDPQRQIHWENLPSGKAWHWAQVAARPCPSLSKAFFPLHQLHPQVAGQDDHQLSRLISHWVNPAYIQVVPLADWGLHWAACSRKFKWQRLHLKGFIFNHIVSPAIRESCTLLYHWCSISVPPSLAGDFCLQVCQVAPVACMFMFQAGTRRKNKGQEVCR